MCCLSVCLVFLFVWSPCSASADSSVAALSVCLSVMSVSSVCLVDLFGLSICLCLCQQLNIDDATPRTPLLCFGLVVTCAREFKLSVRNSLEVALGADTIFFYRNGSFRKLTNFVRFVLFSDFSMARVERSLCLKPLPNL